MIERTETREYLVRSAIDLLSRNTVDRISVRDICANCSLSTRTFYKYFKDKYEVINNAFLADVDRYFTITAEEDVDLHTFILYSTHIVVEHTQFFRNVFLYTGQNNIRVSLAGPLEQRYLCIIGDYFHVPITDDLRYAVQFFARGQLAFVDDALTWAEIPGVEYSVTFFEAALPGLLLPYLHRPIKQLYE